MENAKITISVVGLLFVVATVLLVALGMFALGLIEKIQILNTLSISILSTALVMFFQEK